MDTEGPPGAERPVARPAATTGTEVAEDQQQQQDQQDWGAYNQWNYAYGYGYGGYGNDYYAQQQTFPGVYGYQTGQPQADQTTAGPYAGGEPSHTVWVGGLPPNTTEAELSQIFSGFGKIDNIRLLPPKNCAFVRYYDLESAMLAHAGMTGQFVGNQAVKIGWGKPDSTKEDGPAPCRNLWLGNIEPDVTKEEILEKFSQFGNVEHIRILPHKNCAFVNFDTLESALEAKKSMQGAMLKGKPMKVNFGKLSEGEELPLDPSQLKPPPAPTDFKQKETIDKLAAFVVNTSNPVAFEETMKEKQRGNKLFEFLQEGSEWYAYYKWKIFDTRQKQTGGGAYGAAVVVGSGRIVPPPHTGPELSDADKSALSIILDTLAPTKDSIKKGKDYLMSRVDFASSVCQFICLRVKSTPDFTPKLNIIYLVNDVLHHSAKSRVPGTWSDTWCDAFKPYLSAILNAAYVGQTGENQTKVSQLLDIWMKKSIFDEKSIKELEDDMKGVIPNANPPVPVITSIPWMLKPGAGLSGIPTSAPPAGGYHAVPPPSNLNVNQSSFNNKFAQSQPPQRGGLGPASGGSGRSEKSDSTSLMSSLDSLLSTSRDRSGTRERGERGSERGERDRDRDRDHRDRDRDHTRDRDRDHRDRDRDRDRHDRDRDRHERDRGSSSRRDDRNSNGNYEEEDQEEKHRSKRSRHR